MRTKVQRPSQHTDNRAVGHPMTDRRYHLRALPDPEQRRSPSTAADCEDGCHYCQGPETD